MRRHRIKKRRKSSAVWVLLFITLFVLVIAGIFRVENAISPYAEMQSEQAVRNTANRIITETVSEYITENNYTYSDFASVIYGSDGKPVSIEAVSGNINIVQSELASEINKRLINEKNAATAKIPVGSLSGSYLLAGRGFDIDVRICPAGEASVKLKSSFDSAGVNQTRHSIYAEISASLISSIPLYSFETEQSFEFLIAESIIVGDVPEYAVKAWSGL